MHILVLVTSFFLNLIFVPRTAEWTEKGIRKKYTLVTGRCTLRACRNSEAKKPERPPYRILYLAIVYVSLSYRYDTAHI